MFTLRGWVKKYRELSVQIDLQVRERGGREPTPEASAVYSGLAAMKSLMTSLAIAVALFAFVMVMVIDRLVLVRITQLNRYAHSALQQLGIE